MEKLWVSTVLGSDTVGSKARVLILIHKKIACKVLNIDSNSKGCLLKVHIRLGERELMISNVYAPNTPGRQFFGDKSTRLLKFPHTPHVVGGDFNSTLHLTDDRSILK